jgi:cyclopropane-fatty-acyl-phospholipid synthase
MNVDSLVARAALPSLLRTLERWHEGRLTLQLPDGTVHRFGRPGSGPHVRVRVKSPALLRRVLLQADVGFGESYMEGEWEADDLPRFLHLLARNEDALGVGGLLSRVFNAGNDVLHRLRRNTRRGSRKNISYHYDLSNDFFRLFLDEETMTYSSALFEDTGQTLGEAQRNKFRAIADKARLRAGDHVLEIGCGWGGFAVYAARERGCRVTGITISERQHALARERVAAAGLSHRVAIRLQDYRDLCGSFDKVVSIEMFEALGREHWPVFFRKIEEVLAPEGVAVIQSISVPDHRFEAYERHCDWIQKHIFPGGVLASVHHVTGAMIRTSRLNLHHLEDIGPHYALTLARWREAFLARLPQVRALGFDERFVRTWDFYLACCEAYFEARRIGNLQLVLTRPGHAALGGVPAARREAAVAADASRPAPAPGREVAA